MKRKYIQPNTETINVKLFGSVLEDFGGNPASNHAMDIGAPPTEQHLRGGRGGRHEQHVGNAEEFV